MAKTYPQIRQNNDFILMTVGGNDIGFSKIVMACLVELPGARTCPDQLARSRQLIDSAGFENNIAQVHEALFQRLPRDGYHQVYQLGYSRFFRDDTALSNDQTMGLLPFFKPELTNQLRQELNAISDRLNARLQAIADRYVHYKSTRMTTNGQQTFPDPSWIEIRIPRLTFINPDESGIFDNHRFCEEDNTNLKADDVWTFSLLAPDNVNVPNDGDQAVSASSLAAGMDPNTCVNDPLFETDTGFIYECGMAVYLKDNVTAAGSYWPFPSKEDVIKSFHPKTVGFEALASLLEHSFQTQRPHIDAAGVNSCPASAPQPPDGGVATNAEVIAGAATEVCAASILVSGSGSVSGSASRTGGASASAVATECKYHYRLLLRSPSRVLSLPLFLRHPGIILVRGFS